MKTHDFILIGGGIVGASTAWQLQQRHPRASIVLIEKEAHLAAHQTGRNSGVVHAGVYYQPGSLKAQFCRRGSAATIEFCRENGLPYDQCGKLLVATDFVELERMAALEDRCVLNGIQTQRLSESELRNQEPHIRGLGALFVPATGITDFQRITEAMAHKFVELGGAVKMQTTVCGLTEDKQGITVQTNRERLRSRFLIACGGLLADRLAKMVGLEIDFSLVPFRGEYYRLSAAHNKIVSHLIYPIPDPALPFLGVHLTRMIDGSVTVGPNAVLALKREGYGRLNLDWQDIREMVAFPGFWRMINDHRRHGIAEFRDSLFKNGYLARVHKYCPEITLADLHPHPVGIRPQAVLRDGSLVHDFLFVDSPRSLHVCNAPSPAATSAIPIGAYLCDKAAQHFQLI